MPDKWTFGWGKDLHQQIEKEIENYKPKTKRQDCEETLRVIYLILKNYFEGDKK
jgi:hypothetical protein